MLALAPVSGKANAKGWRHEVAALIGCIQNSYACTGIALTALRRILLKPCANPFALDADGFLHDQDKRVFHFAGGVFGSSNIEEREKGSGLDRSENRFSIFLKGGDPTRESGRDFHRLAENLACLMGIAHFEDTAFAIEGNAFADHLLLEIMGAEHAEFMFLRNLWQPGADGFERFVRGEGDNEILFHSATLVDRQALWTNLRPSAREIVAKRLNETSAPSMRIAGRSRNRLFRRLARLQNDDLKYSLVELG